MPHFLQDIQRPLRPPADRRRSARRPVRFACRRRPSCLPIRLSCRSGPKSHCGRSGFPADDAYGNPLDFTPANALTNLLYTGEIFDQCIAMQYLRARYYDPASGTFSRLDPFAGNMQDPQSLHKYLYVHGDPVQGIDPTGLILSGFSLGFAIGFTLPIAASFVVWHFEEQAANRPGVITPWLLLTRPSEYDTHGTWRAWGYLRTVLGRFPNADEQTTAGDGCIGLLRVRLGLSGGGRTPWNEISNTKAFIAKHPTDNSVNFDSALNEALAVYNTFASDGDLDQPWLYMFVNRSVGLPVAPTLRAGSLEVNPADISFAEVGDFNYASRLLLKDGNTTWESAIEGRTSMWTTLFWRHDLDKTDGDQVYVFVSPKRNPAMVDVR